MSIQMLGMLVHANVHIQHIIVNSLVEVKTTKVVLPEAKITNDRSLNQRRSGLATQSADIHAAELAFTDFSESARREVTLGRTF